MNYEEMLNAQEGVVQNREQTPLGVFYKKQIDRKYRSVIELKAELADSLLFCEGLRRDQQEAMQMDDPHLLKYELHEDSGGIYELELLQGNVQTLSQLLSTEPAVVTSRGFVEDTIAALMELTERLHERGIFHLCYAPQTVFMRKSDNLPMLLCHGSSFLALKEPALLYAGFENDVAPEVMDAEALVDERSDIYALGRFIEHLYDSSDMPYEYKAVVKRATAQDPARRFTSVGEMRQALAKKRGAKRSLVMLLAALAIVGVVVWAYFDLTPETADIEFVDNTGLVPSADPFSENYDPVFDSEDMEEYIDPEIAMYLDTMNLETMTEEEIRKITDSLSTSNEVERIFRRRFTERANSSLAKLYSNSSLGSSESSFIAHSQEVIEELMNYAGQLADEADMPKDVASTLAMQIISRLQAQMQTDVTRYGSMTKPSDDDNQ